MHSVNRFVWSGLAIVCLATLGYTLLRAEDSARSSRRELDQNGIIQQRRDERRILETNRDWVRTRVISGRGSAQTFDSPVFRDGSIPRTPSASTGQGVPTSPGQNIGMTSFDYQANSSQAHQVARTGDNLANLHFTWMSFPEITGGVEEPNRRVTYGYWTDPQNYPAMTGGTYDGDFSTGADQRGGYCNIDVTPGNFATVGLHVLDGEVITAYRPLNIAFPYGDATPQVFALGGYDTTCPGSWESGGVLWARIAADRSSNFVHEIAHSNINDCPDHKLWYWRFNGTSWSSNPGFIDNTEDISYALAVDANSSKVAVVVHGTDAGNTNVYFIESTADGADWLSSTTPLPRTAITNYTDPEGPQAWQHLTATYDNSTPGALHVMWDEQERSGSGHTAIKHWNSERNTIRTSALGYWDCPVSTSIFNLNLAKLSMGIGDGSTSCGGESNDNYVYCTYTQFGGNTAAELQDYSDETSVEGRNGGYMNGEICLVVSNSGGNTWSPSVNLTNTKTPGCNPGVSTPHLPDPTSPDDCASEHWATINRVVADLDILFIVDRDPGGIPQGEGSWQMNPVHYLKLSGSGLTTAGGVCPVIAPVFEATLSSVPDCEYNASRFGSTTATLTIMNLGNAPLNQGAGSGIVVTDFPGLPTLMVPVTGHYTVNDGAPPLVQTITMNSNNAAEGLYTGQISISHNDVTKPDPYTLPIEFFVFDEFFCPKGTPRMVTGATDPSRWGTLSLYVRNDGRFASQAYQGGLWRHSDSSSSILDGSLLLAHGTQGPGVDDTTVFLHYADRASNGQNGWRPQSDLMVDTSQYGLGTGYATASAYMSTKDSVMGCNMTWYFPQDPALDEVVICNYTIFPGPNWVARGKPAINNVTVGTLTDFNVFPAQRPPLDTSQIGANNHSVSHNDNLDRELAFFTCKKKPGYTGTGLNNPERFRAGILAPSGYQGSFTGLFAADLDVGGGPTDGRLYFLLKNVSGDEIFDASPASNDTDRYVLMGLESDQTYQAASSTYQISTVHNHTIILASDTLSEASFFASCDAAAGAVGFPYPGTEKASSAPAAPFDGCGTCPCRYDPNCDGNSDVVDAVHVVGGAFRNIVVDPAIAIRLAQAGCNFDSRDVDASGTIDVLDASKIVAVVFRGTQVTASNSFVNPCTKWKDWNSMTAGDF